MHRSGSVTVVGIRGRITRRSSICCISLRTASPAFYPKRRSPLFMPYCAVMVAMIGAAAVPHLESECASKEGADARRSTRAMSTSIAWMALLFLNFAGTVCGCLLALRPYLPLLASDCEAEWSPASSSPFSPTFSLPCKSFYSSRLVVCVASQLPLA